MWLQKQYEILTTTHKILTGGKLCLTLCIKMYVSVYKFYCFNFEHKNCLNIASNTSKIHLKFRNSPHQNFAQNCITIPLKQSCGKYSN